MENSRQKKDDRIMLSDSWTKSETVTKSSEIDSKGVDSSSEEEEAAKELSHLLQRVKIFNAERANDPHPPDDDWAEVLKWMIDERI